MVHNFNAGPSALPQEVKQQCIQAIQNFKQSGLSILEIGHRTKDFEQIIADAQQLCLELMGLSANDYDVIFLQGGATTQFFQIPMNFLDEGETAHYINTGVWSSKAIQVAQNFGNVNVLASSEASNFNHIPKNFSIPKEGAYLHLTSNNTIYGSQWQHFPSSPLPMVIDMSSDLLSRKIDFSQFACIYAGAQKNVGIAGCTVVVLKKTFHRKISRKIPSMLQYMPHIENGSMLNTPPVFAIYVAYLTLNWIKQQGGTEAMEHNNTIKANMLYDTIDNSLLFKGTIAKEDRSQMNVCFVAINETIEKKFLNVCKEAGIYGIKGHRSSGGFRASLYNAVSIESTAYLCQLIQDFTKQEG